MTPRRWWAEAAEGITWYKRWDAVFDPSSGPFGRWFPGAVMNTCYNCLDRHVAAGRGDQPALIWDSAMTGKIVKFTYAELRDRVAKVAGALAALGVGHGDRVVIYMPMVPEAAIAMLACARLGAIHSRGVRRLRRGGAGRAHRRREAQGDRLGVLRPGAGAGGRNTSRCSTPRSRCRRTSRLGCLILQREQATADADAGPRPRFPRGRGERPRRTIRCRWRRPTRCTFSTRRARPGKPKGMVRDNGGHAVALWNTMMMIYGLDAGDVFWAASDVGWVVGHSYIVYAPLLRGCTGVMYEGKPVGTPDAGAFWRVVAQHGVKVLFTAPTAIRAIRQQDPDGAFPAKYDLSKLEVLFLAGERCDPPTAIWAAELLKQAGGRSLVADRDRLGDHRRVPRVSGCSRSSPAPAGAPAPATTCTRWTTTGAYCRRARSAICASACRCRRAARRRCGTTTRATATPTSPTSRAGIAPAMPA